MGLAVKNATSGVRFWTTVRPRQPEGTEYRALHLRSTEKTFKTKRIVASARIKICVLQWVCYFRVNGVKEKLKVKKHWWPEKLKELWMTTYYLTQRALRLLPVPIDRQIRGDQSCHIWWSNLGLKASFFKGVFTYNWSQAASQLYKTE